MVVLGGLTRETFCSNKRDRSFNPSEKLFQIELRHANLTIDYFVIQS